MGPCESPGIRPIDFRWARAALWALEKSNLRGRASAWTRQRRISGSRRGSGSCRRRSRCRRAIHQEPELGLHNPKTTEKAKAALAGLPLEIFEGESTSGFVAVLRGPANGRTVLLRGDMDALPLTEDTGPALQLAPRRGHACLRP